MADSTRIDFIRHTRLKGISGSLCYGATDLAVADTFPTEAEEVRLALEGRVYDAVFTSPLQRAGRLADYCGFGGVAVQDHRLAERDFGDWEMRPWAEVYAEVRRRPDLTPAEERNPELVTPPHGEGIEEMSDRVADLIREICLRDEWHHVACFCHGGVINMARRLQGIISTSDLFIDVPPYGSVTTLTFSLSDFSGR